MIKVIVSHEFQKFAGNIRSNIDLTVVNKDNILNVIANDKYDAFVLSNEFNDVLYSIRNTHEYHNSCIITYNKSKTFCLFSDLLISEDINCDNVVRAFNFLDEFFIPMSKEGTLAVLKKIMVAADSDLKTQLYRVPILTNFLIECMQKENTYTELLTQDFVSDLISYSTFHDLGKILIVQEVLDFTGKYDEYHRRTMNLHPKLGKQFYDLVSTIFPAMTSTEALNIMKYHHEKYDGSGYPNKLKGEEIPLEARIVAVADVYDALRSKRKYKPEFTHEDSFRILVNDAGTHFDPIIIKCLEKYEKELEKIYDDLI